MKRIIHIINSLHSGGAENMLYKIIKHSDKEEYYHEIIVLRSGGILSQKITKQGVKIHNLSTHNGNIFKQIRKSIDIMKHFDIVNTWLYHSDFYGFIIGKLILKKKLIWNIRHSNLDKNANKAKTLMIVKINSLLSRYVDYITYNSKEAIIKHKKVGYADKNSILVLNGFEMDKYNYSLSDRINVRKSLDIDLNENVFITVGRWNIQKDYFTLIESLNLLKNDNIDFKMLMVGNKLDINNEELVNIIDKYNLNNNILLLGRRDDIPQILSSSDIYISSSLGESFSNTIGEAMACELPCVVTDVGESRNIVGDYGKVVNSKDYTGLKDAIYSMINLPELRIMGKQARKRIKTNYDINNIVKLYEKLYDNK